MLVLPEGTAGITPTDLHNTDVHQPRADKRPSNTRDKKLKKRMDQV